jgi:hypothetical protein
LGAQPAQDVPVATAEDVQPLSATGQLPRERCEKVSALVRSYAPRERDDVARSLRVGTDRRVWNRRLDDFPGQFRHREEITMHVEQKSRRENH